MLLINLLIKVSFDLFVLLLLWSMICEMYYTFLNEK